LDYKFQLLAKIRLAQEKTYLGISSPIPANQWQIEVSLWFSTCLAKEQQWAVEWATAPTFIDFAPQGNTTGAFTTNPPTDAAAKQQCRQQLVHNAGGYQSFSVLGIALILALGGLIIVTGLTVDTIAASFGPESSKFRREQWDAEETLALHSSLYAANGLGSDGLDEQLPPVTALLRGRKGTTDTENQRATGEKDSEHNPLITEL
jgi:hypothetical protein